MDKNNDKKISVEDLSGFKRNYADLYSPEDREKIINDYKKTIETMDKNNDGVVDISDAAKVNVKGNSERKYISAIEAGNSQKYDLNQDGKIDQEDLNLLENSDQKGDENEFKDRKETIEGLIENDITSEKSVDLNNDGKIDEQDYELSKEEQYRYQYKYNKHMDGIPVVDLNNDGKFDEKDADLMDKEYGDYKDSSSDNVDNDTE